MGCTVSNYADKELAARSKAIDRSIKADRELKAKEIKLLLLGEFFALVRSSSYFIYCLQGLGNLERVPS